MWQTISRVYSQWVLPQNITLADQQIVQLYLNNPIKTEPDLVKTELYFAVDESAYFFTSLAKRTFCTAEPFLYV